MTKVVKMCQINLPRMWYATCVTGVSREIVTKHDTNALWRDLSLSRSRLVLYSVNSVIDGSGVKEVWQCIRRCREVKSTTDGPVNQFPLVCGVVEESSEDPEI